METYPNVSILMPTYNRRKFLPLIMYNLKNMDYDKSKLEWCILDDGKKPLFENAEKLNEVKKELHPMKINYVYISICVNYTFNYFESFFYSIHRWHK